MVASHETVKALLEITRSYIDPRRYEDFLQDLEGIRGNVSFRGTIVLLRREYENMKRGKK
jgi:hypothetical protein